MLRLSIVKPGNISKCTVYTAVHLEDLEVNKISWTTNKKKETSIVRFSSTFAFFFFSKILKWIFWAIRKNNARRVCVKKEKHCDIACVKAKWRRLKIEEECEWHKDKIIKR